MANLLISGHGKTVTLLSSYWKSLNMKAFSICLENTTCWCASTTVLIPEPVKNTAKRMLFRQLHFSLELQLLTWFYGMILE